MGKILATFLSRKFLATAAATWLVVWFHFSTLEDLKGIDAAKSSALTTIYITTSGTLGAILIGYLGFQTLQTKFGLSGVAQVMAERHDGKTEHTETQNITERLIHEYADRYKDDPSYAPIRPDTEEEFR